MKRSIVNLTAFLLIILLALTACSPASTTKPDAAGTTGTTAAGASTTAATAATTSPAETEASGWESDPNLNEPGVEPICKETVTLTVGLREHANVTDFATNDMTKLIEDRTNFKLDFQFYTSEMATQINLIVAGGDFESLPDVLLLAPGCQ